MVYAVAFMSLGLLNLQFDRNWWQGQRLRLALGLPLLVLYVYFAMPALVFPQAFTLLLLPLIPNAAYSLLGAARTFAISRRIVSIRRAPILPYVYALGALGVLAAVLAAMPFVDAGGLRDLADVTVSTSLPPSADLRHVRIVPQEAAVFAGNKVVGQLGAYYAVGDFNVQVAGGKLVWVAPLEFHGVVQWLARRTSPGVIVVSAEDPDASPELRARAPLRYIPSALLNDNLYRHVYLRYGTQRILETTLQLDDTGAPQYICTLGRPTIGYTGDAVTGVVLVDPATGAMRYVSRAAFSTLPAWVSRVYPADLALQYNTWFGAYVHGLINYLAVRRDVHVPARGEVFGLLAGNQFVWFVDHTSPANDQSMTGFTYMDTVTGKMVYYTSAGGEFNSRGAEDAVASNPVVRQGKLYPTQPLLYNVFERNTWIVPLVAETGKYQTVALVQAKNGHVVVGSSSNPSPQTDAFAQQAALLHIGPPPARSGEGGAAAGGHSVVGTVDRLTASGATVYFTLLGAKRVYALDARGDAGALLTRSGDRVRFTAATPAGGIATASGFSNATLGR